MRESSTSRPDLWMIRTFQNRLLGPFTAAEVRSKILSRELTVDDEICQANHFWFSLHEPAELKSQLGIDVPPRVRRSDEEITETETETETETGSLSQGFPQQNGQKVGVRKMPTLRVETAGGYESPALLRSLAWILFFAGSGLLVWVYLILRSG